jgi:drug/metabolite transporter (DMT)-like permease
MEASSDRILFAAFALNGLLAGGNAVGIRFSNRELDPLWGAGLRFALAAALLLALMAALGLELPRPRALAGAVAFGALNFGGAFGLGYYAFVELHAGFGQILLSLVPLMTLLLAVAWGQERIRAPALLGTGLALAGVALMSRAPLRESVPLLSLLAALGGALCFAQAAVLVRRLPPISPVTMNAVGMTAGAALLLAGSMLAEESQTLPSSTETWAAVSYLVVVGSVAVFLLYLFILRQWAASRAAYVFVVIPFVTVLLSAWLDAEPVGWSLVFGGLLVLAGVYVGALRPAVSAASPS